MSTNDIKEINSENLKMESNDLDATGSTNAEADANAETTVINETAEDMEAVMRKYDRESATRIWEGKPKYIVTAITAVFSVFCIWSTLFSTAALEIRMTAFLGMVVIIGYLTYPVNKKNTTINKIPWYDVVIMLAGSASFFYYCVNYNSLIHILTSAAKMTPFYIIVGIVAILTMAELCRRCVGIPILCVVGVLIAYTFYSMMSGGQSLGVTLGRTLYTLFYSTSGMLSTPVQVCAKFIAVFIIFGAFLEHTGISAFFINLANSLFGSLSGGPAKVAVVSSALCGMVSGSSVGNTVTTGSVTIPMMKKTGYRPEFAGAVEAASSTGGQIMPPIMGAAAFLMAEYMGVSYANVALWAILPAILYFSGIFIAVHLEAKKNGLGGIQRSLLPNFWQLQKKVYLLLPLVILIGLVATNIRSLQYSASVAIIVAILVSMPHIIIGSRKNHNGEKNSPGTVVKITAARTGKMIFDSLVGGGKNCVSVVVACSMAGMIAGCITATGLASRLVSAVVNVSNKIPNPLLAMLFCLLLTMLCCIILGMGVPTTANYCIMASTCAPILITMGVDKIAAHFFVFYFGIVADITPPVALAAYAGSAIAKSNPIKTGVNATKLAIAAFVVPYVFAINPSMLLMNEGVINAVLVCITSLIGIFAIAAALNGYTFRKCYWFERLIFIAGGISLLVPGIISDVVGVVLVATVMMIQFKSRKIKHTDSDDGENLSEQQELIRNVPERLE